MSDPATRDPKEAYLHSACHPASPTWAVIEKNHVLRIECAECGKVVGRLALAQWKPDLG